MEFRHFKCIFCECASGTTFRRCGRSVFELLELLVLWSCRFVCLYVYQHVQRSEKAVAGKLRANAGEV